MTRLHLKALADKVTFRDLKEALPNLPTTAVKLYQDALIRIKSQSEDESKVALRAISWTSHASQPLTAQAMLHAFAVKPKDKKFDPDGVITDDQLITLCAGLLEVQSGEIRFVHDTINSFLASNNEEWLQSGDQDISKTCMTYLSSEDFHNACDQSELIVRLGKYPFLRHAAYNLGVYASRCSETNLHHEFVTRTDIPLGCYQVAATTVLSSIRPDRVKALSSECSILHKAVLWGIVPVVKRLIEEGSDTEAVGPEKERALHWAARLSSEKIVELLLQKPVNNTATNSNGQSALDMVMMKPYQKNAIRIFDTDFVQSLEPWFKKWVASIENSNPSGFYLQAAEYLVNSDLKKLKRMPDLVVRTMDISESSAKVARLLIEHSADVNSEKSNGPNPLQLATLYKRTELVELLLEKGANPFLKSKFGVTAFDIAKFQKNEALSDILSRRMETLKDQERSASDESAKRGETYLL